MASRLLASSTLAGLGGHFASPLPCRRALALRGTAVFGFPCAYRARLGHRFFDRPPMDVTSVNPPSSSFRARPLSAAADPRNRVLRAIPEPKILPLPAGVDGSRMGLYQIVGSEGSGPGKDGARAILGVHGPREYWLGGGGNIQSAAGGSFAVIELPGRRQYKVMAGDVLYTNRIPGEVNTTILLDKVVLYGTMLYSVFGRPHIPGAVVKATVESQTKTAKVMVTKFKKRKGYLRTKGHRQPITRLHIDSINYQVPEENLIIPYKVPFDPKRPPRRNNPRYL